MATIWRDVSKVVAPEQADGTIVASSSAALRVDDQSVYGNITFQESMRGQKQFRFVYDGFNFGGTRVSGTVDLPLSDWVVETKKVMSANARARLIWMKFAACEKFSVIQVTIPIKNHSDSKRSKAFVEAITIYACHHIERATGTDTTNKNAAEE